MKCPVCGEEIPAGKHKCLRCGYDVRSLSTIVSDPEEEVTPTVDIDPSKVHISGGSRPVGGGIFDDFFGGGLFGGILDGLFGGFFDGFDDRDDDDGITYDDFGSPISSDVYDGDCVELKAHEVEYIDDRAEPKKTHNGAQSEYKDPHVGGDRKPHKDESRKLHKDESRKSHEHGDKKSGEKHRFGKRRDRRD